MRHELKSWPQFFEAQLSGDKTFELRRNDRNYQVGDTLVLREFSPLQDNYTGRVVERTVTYITNGDNRCAASAEALNPGFCILSTRYSVRAP